MSGVKGSDNGHSISKLYKKTFENICIALGNYFSMSEVANEFIYKLIGASWCRVLDNLITTLYAKKEAIRIGMRRGAQLCTKIGTIFWSYRDVHNWLSMTTSPRHEYTMKCILNYDQFLPRIAMSSRSHSKFGDDVSTIIFFAHFGAK